MPFTLRIGFGGLCLFVLDRKSQPKTMHVLLPATPGVPHERYLVHEANAEFEEAPASNTPGPLRQLDLVSWTVHAHKAELMPPPAAVVDLHEITNVFANPRLIEDTSVGGNIRTRVVLDAGKATMDPCAGGAWWRVNGVSRPFAIRVAWEMTIKGNALAVPDGSGWRTLFPKPFGAPDRVLEIWVMQTTDGEHPASFPPKSRKVGAAKYDYLHHFHFLTELAGVSTVSPPTFDHPDRHENDPLGCWDDPVYRAMEVTCIGAAAPIAP